MKYTLIVSKDGNKVILKESDNKKDIEEFWACIRGCYEELCGYKREKE
jgi:hypothetical protein